jgi:hypothetical protein
VAREHRERPARALGDRPQLNRSYDMAYCAIQAPLCNGPFDSKLKPVGSQKEQRPAILRQSVEVLRYIGGTRRYRVRADFLFGEWIRICPVEITEKTNDLPHLPWRWWAKRFQYEVKSAVLIRDLDWACEVLREWARELISENCQPTQSADYPCGYCEGKWPDRPVFWGTPAAPCSVCAVKYPWLLD